MLSWRTNASSLNPFGYGTNAIPQTHGMSANLFSKLRYELKSHGRQAGLGCNKLLLAPISWVKELSKATNAYYIKSLYWCNQAVNPQHLSNLKWSMVNIDVSYSISLSYYVGIYASKRK
jgi:hypothetical protein